MGLRFRKSIRLAPGVRMNLGLSGRRLSLGSRGGLLRCEDGDPVTDRYGKETSSHPHGNSQMRRFLSAPQGGTR